MADLYTFDDRKSLAEAMADRVVQSLSEAIGARDQATMAVSGGSTPKLFFQTLSQRSLDWSKVTITLVDERFVPVESPRSNHRLVNENLLQNKAAAARFVPLYQPVASVEAAAEMASVATAELGPPFDVVILGMGEDGHTASFFPHGTTLQTALDPTTPRRVMPMEAPDAGEPRLTFTFSALQDAWLLILHIEGDNKKQVLDRAQQGDAEMEMPIRAILNRTRSPLNIYWAP